MIFMSNIASLPSLQLVDEIEQLFVMFDIDGFGKIPPVADETDIGTPCRFLIDVRVAYEQQIARSNTKALGGHQQYVRMGFAALDILAGEDDLEILLQPEVTGNVAHAAAAVGCNRKRDASRKPGSASRIPGSGVIKGINFE